MPLRSTAPAAGSDGKDGITKRTTGLLPEIGGKLCQFAEKGGRFTCRLVHFEVGSEKKLRQFHRRFTRSISCIAAALGVEEPS